MPRRSNKKKKVSLGLVSKPTGFQLDGISLTDMDEIAQTTNMGRVNVVNIVATFVVICILIQLRLSLLHEKAEYFDQIPSYRRYRSTCLKGSLGTTMVALYALYKSIPIIADYSLKVGSDIVNGYSAAAPVNQKRITPGSGTWQAYLGGEFSSALGKLLSCPSTNITIFNIEARWVREVDFKGVYNSILSQLSKSKGWTDVSITPSEIKSGVRDALFTQPGGLLVDNITFTETNVLSSKIEKNMFGDLLIRDGTVNSILAKGGAIPDSPISPTLVNQHLTSIEQLQYASAQRQGLVGVLKTLNAKIIERSKGNSEKSQNNETSVNDPSPRRRGKSKI